LLVEVALEISFQVVVALVDIDQVRQVSLSEQLIL
jgi:hypothetical protein